MTPVSCFCNQSIIDHLTLPLKRPSSRTSISFEVWVSSAILAMTVLGRIRPKTGLHGAVDIGIEALRAYPLRLPLHELEAL